MNPNQPYAHIPRVTAPEMLLHCRSGLMRYRSGWITLQWEEFNGRVHLYAFDTYGMPMGRLLVDTTFETVQVQGVETGGGTKMRLKNGLSEAPPPKDSRYALASRCEMQLQEWVPGDLIPSLDAPDPEPPLPSGGEEPDRLVESVTERAAEAEQRAEELEAAMKAQVDRHQEEVQQLEAERDALQAKVKGTQAALDMNRMWLHDARRQAQVAASEANQARAKGEGIESRYFATICQHEPVAALLGEGTDREAVRGLLRYVVHGRLPEGVTNGFSRPQHGGDGSNG